MAVALLSFLLAACNVVADVAQGPPGARYRCAEFAFDPATIEQPGTAERDNDPRSDALRDHLTQDGEPASLPDTGWHLVGSDANRAEFVAMTVNGYHFVQLERREDIWTVAGWGGCPLELVLIGDARAATWDLATDPTVESTSITVLVSERSCASGKPPGDRIVGPQVVIEPGVIRIAFGVRPIPGGQDCQGSPPGRVEVDLGQPIGDRPLSDFGLWPPVNVWAPSGP